MSDNIPLAVAYRLLGSNFVASARTLYSSMELNGDGTPAKLTAIPFYFLVSHAAELFLKCALLKRGSTEKGLRNHGIAHSLNTLLASLQSKGVSVSPTTINIIDQLHDQHLKHDLRYSVFVDNGEKTFLPPPASILSMLEELSLLTRIST